MRFRKAERMAAMAVLAAAAAVAGAGVRLAKRHTEYLMKKAAAKFEGDDAGEEPAAQPEACKSEDGGANAEPEACGPEDGNVHAEPEEGEPEAGADSGNGEL